MHFRPYSCSSSSTAKPCRRTFANSRASSFSVEIVFAVELVQFAAAQEERQLIGIEIRQQTFANR